MIWVSWLVRRVLRAGLTVLIFFRCFVWQFSLAKGSWVFLLSLDLLFRKKESFRVQTEERRPQKAGETKSIFVWLGLLCWICDEIIWRKLMYKNWISFLFIEGQGSKGSLKNQGTFPAAFTMMEKRTMSGGSTNKRLWARILTSMLGLFWVGIIFYPAFVWTGP